MKQPAGPPLPVHRCVECKLEDTRATISIRDAADEQRWFHPECWERFRAAVLAIAAEGWPMRPKSPRRGHRAPTFTDTSRPRARTRPR